MGWLNFAIIVGSCMFSILICRAAPVLALKGRKLPKRLDEALSFIPPATFAALIVNDLFNVSILNTLQSNVWEFLLPWLAALPVVIVAIRLRSLIWCIVTGVVCYGLLTLLPSLFS